MNMKLGLGAALLATSLLVGGTASAATTCTYGTETIFTGPSTSADVVTSLACVGELDIGTGGFTVEDLNAALLGGTNLWEDVGKLESDGDDGSLSMTGLGTTFGNWTILGFDPLKTYALGLKSSTSFAAYILSGSTGTWNTNAIKNGQGETQDLSNAILFSTDSANVILPTIPLPAGMPLMLAGLGAMAFLARRKARKA